MNKKILMIASSIALGAFAAAGSVYAAAGDNQVAVNKQFAHSTVDVSTGIDVTTADLGAGSKTVTIGTFCVSTNATDSSGQRHFRVSATNTLPGVTGFKAKGYDGTDTEASIISYIVAVNSSGVLTDGIEKEVAANGGTHATSCSGAEENVVVTLTNLDPANTRAGLYRISFSVSAAVSQDHGNEAISEELGPASPAIPIS